jgi:Flp pilus assembly protein TadG
MIHSRPRPAVRLSSNLAAQERGTVAIMTALVMMLFVGMLAIVVDVGYAYGRRRMAQNVADSGSVAAAGVIGLSLVAGGRTDGDVATAIADIARHSSGGFSGGYTAVYVDGAWNALSPAITVGQAAGNAIPSSALGVAATPRKTFAAFFGRALGVTWLNAGATATAVSQVVSGVDQSRADFAPYAIWAGNAPHPCGNGASSALCLGDDVIYRSNQYQADNVFPADNPNWEGNAADFKGYLHHGDGFLSVGDNVTDGGNAIGEQPVADVMRVRWAAGQTVIMPVVDHETGNGSDMQLHVIGFAAVLLLNEPTLPASGAWHGRVVARSVASGATTGGNAPPGWLPSVRYARLVR